MNNVLIRKEIRANEMSTGDIANISIESALVLVQTAFARHPMPVHATYCACCHNEEEMQRNLHSILNALSSEDLNFLFRDAYWTGIDWPSLAFYVPEAMERFAVGDKIEENIVLYKLLLASRPDVESGAYVQEGMDPTEREAISLMVQAVLAKRLHTQSYTSDEYAFRELLAFLVCFDWPIAPFLERWKQATDTVARANLCFFLIDYLLNYGKGRRILKGIYYDEDVTPLPQNQDALNTLLSPEAIAAYLMENVRDTELIAPEWETGIGAAFDWAVHLMEHQ